MASSAEMEEESSFFDLETSNQRANLPVSSVRSEADAGEHESKPSEARPSTEGNDFDRLVDNLSRRNQLSLPTVLFGQATHQWIFMVETQIFEVRRILEGLYPEAAMEKANYDSVLKLIRQVEKKSNKFKHRLCSRNLSLSLMVDRIRAYFTQESSYPSGENGLWLSVSELFRWVKGSGAIQNALLEERRKASEAYRAPLDLSSEERALVMHRFETTQLKKSVAELKARFNEAMAVLLGEQMIARHKLTSVLIQPTKKIFNQNFALTWKFDEAMEVAEALKERRDSLKKKLDHLSYLVSMLSTAAKHNLMKQVESEGTVPDQRVKLPVVVISITKYRQPSFKVRLLLHRKITKTANGVLICSRKPMEVLCDSELLHQLHFPEPTLLPADVSTKVEPRWTIELDSSFKL